MVAVGHFLRLQQQSPRDDQATMACLTTVCSQQKRTFTRNLTLQISIQTIRMRGRRLAREAKPFQSQMISTRLFTLSHLPVGPA